MIFKIDDDKAFSTGWLIRGWSIGYRYDKTPWVPSSIYTAPRPEWYAGKAKVICPSMMEGWSKKLLTARQV